VDRARSIHLAQVAVAQQQATASLTQCRITLFCGKNEAVQATPAMVESSQRAGMGN